MTRFLILALLAGGLMVPTAARAEPTAAERGYELLLEKAYLPADLNQRIFDQLWRDWPEPLRSRAKSATAEERRRMAFGRYGLTERPGDKSGRPLQYVVDKAGNWSMNCFACHGGKVAGQVVPGLPNSHFALATLTEDVRRTKTRLGVPPGRLEIGAAFMPLGGSNGTTNAVNFGVVLLAFRDADLNLKRPGSMPKMVHHDMEPPPWWHLKRKKQIYIDGFAQKGHRGLMQFMLVRQNGPERFREWEDDYRKVYAWLESLEPPPYPWPIDRQLAARGRAAFEQNCARCHGTYGEKASYPEVTVPIAELGTDRMRLDALSAEQRRRYGLSWFGHYGRHKTVAEPKGYVAPPLDGVWASAPYFHNGSVPTLWHVLHPNERPTVWKRSEDGYDRRRVGLEVETFKAVPKAARRGWQRRQYFDTRQKGKSAAGHEFPEQLTPDEKRAVLEYLKTL